MMEGFTRITAAADGAVGLGLVYIEIGNRVDRKILPELSVW